ncbi:MAG: hypothetical protein DRK00_03320 [Thermoprotei archaeon]|nr:MAG: hypothetical protein DRK00_03320 [Thermoprotei archaeon]
MPIPPSHHSVRLLECSSIASILRLVTEGVSRVLGVRKRDVRLRVEKLPRSVYALHILGTNIIVLNEEALRRLPDELSGDKVLVNSYTYFILLHEYLHLLGIVDERQVYEYARKVCKELLGRYHPATLLTMHGPPAPPPRALKSLLRSRMLFYL